MEGSKMQGILTSWRKERAFGFVMDEARKQYFLHITGIIAGPAIPAIGSLVEFDISSAHKNGKLPQAVNAKIGGMK